MVILELVLLPRSHEDEVPLPEAELLSITYNLSPSTEDEDLVFPGMGVERCEAPGEDFEEPHGEVRGTVMPRDKPPDIDGLSTPLRNLLCRNIGIVHQLQSVTSTPFVRK